MFIMRKRGQGDETTTTDETNTDVMERNFFSMSK